MGERFLACYSETAEAARGNDANCLATFPQNGAIANVGYEGSSSPSDGDSSVRCMSTDGRFPPDAVQYYGAWSWAGESAVHDPQQSFEARRGQRPLCDNFRTVSSDGIPDTLLWGYSGNPAFRKAVNLRSRYSLLM